MPTSAEALEASATPTTRTGLRRVAVEWLPRPDIRSFNTLISAARNEGYPAGISDTQERDHFDVAARLQMDLHLGKHFHPHVQGCHAKEGCRGNEEDAV